LYFSHWGVNYTRRNILINNNVFYHNGYGTPKAGQTYYWMTGGLNNIFSNNRGFQIGYSDLFLKDYRSWQVVAREQNIQINGNLIDGHNTIDSAIESGGNAEDRVKIYAIRGSHAVFGDPLFKDLANQDFSPRSGSPAARVAVGAYTPGSPSKLWWKRDFPPRLFRVRLNGTEWDLRLSRRRAQQ
jgi:hypothetical protein